MLLSKTSRGGWIFPKIFASVIQTRHNALPTRNDNYAKFSQFVSNRTLKKILVKILWVPSNLTHTRPTLCASSAGLASLECADIYQQPARRLAGGGARPQVPSLGTLQALLGRLRVPPGWSPELLAEAFTHGCLSLNAHISSLGREKGHLQVASGMVALNQGGHFWDAQKKYIILQIDLECSSVFGCTS